MINRVIIRIKLLQVIYSYYQKQSTDLNLAEKELMFSLQKTYDLYHYLLLLIPALTDAQQKRLDLRKHKYLATAAELNPDLRFVNNKFAEQIRRNKQLQAFFNEKGSVWVEDDTHFIKSLLENVIESDIYKSYLESENSYNSDQEFWKKVFKDIICQNEELFDFLEDKSIYWNDDLEITGTFVLKTIKKFEEGKGDDMELLPMFRSEEDREFAIELLHKSILNGEEYGECITRHIKNWDLDRIANMDLYIMQIAIAELLNFPSIPVNVTLNEYIDMAKFYSTSKSGNFINGILDAIVGELKKENKLFKN